MECASEPTPLVGAASVRQNRSFWGNPHLAKKVRVAIIGVGNCASSLIQGVHFYRAAAADTFVPGLMHVVLGDYHVGDVEFSAAFDVDRNKVGKDLAEAIFALPNNTIKFAEVPPLGVRVSRGATLDGLGHYQSAVVDEAAGSADN